MKTYLYANGGLAQVPGARPRCSSVESGVWLQEGIFRLAPDQDACARTKEQLNTNTFESCSDINIIANLMKVWFREIPEHLLDEVPISDLSESDNVCVSLCVAAVYEPS